MKTITVNLPTDPSALRDFVKDCDAAIEARMEAAIESSAALPTLRMVGLTGPTCAGKTTTAGKLTDSLRAHGHRVHVVSLDDFYYDKEYLHNRVADNPNVEIDYDSEETINCALFAEKVASLWRGDPTPMPRFDFRSGMTVAGDIIDPDEGDVFLFEGIQVLYPKINAILSQYGSYRNIYIAPETAIVMGDRTFAPNRIRLMRRLVRDYHRRNADGAFTLFLWESVRANEEKNIFSNLAACHEFIDSTMPYEIGMLKPYLEKILAEVPETDEFYGVSREILQSVEGISTVPADYMTEHSLYKEFI